MEAEQLVVPRDPAHKLDRHLEVGLAVDGEDGGRAAEVDLGAQPVAVAEDAVAGRAAEGGERAARAEDADAAEELHPLRRVVDAHVPQVVLLQLQ